MTANYTHGGTAQLSNSYANYHDYGLNWTPSQLQWTVDGNVVRTLTKSSTLNNSTGVYNYPDSPSRIQLSIWPAGIAAQPLGTQQWAGGLINWNTSDYNSAGYYYALGEYRIEIKNNSDILLFSAVQSVTIVCDTSNLNGISYVYGANSSITGEPAVLLTNQSTQIYSEAATGLAMGTGKTTASR